MMLNEMRETARFDTGRVCYLKLDNYYFPLIDISEGGFSAEIKKGVLKEGEMVEIEIKISDRYGSTTFKTSTEIIRSKNDHVAGKWDLSFTSLAGHVKEYFSNRYNKIAV